MSKKLLIIGAGSVGKFIAYNINEFTQPYDIIGFLDDDFQKHNTIMAGFPVLGPVSMLEEFSGKEIAIVWGIAFPKIKQQLFEKYKNLTFDFPSFISKDAWISRNVEIGCGVIIYPGTSINYECTIDDFVVINMNCSLGHNSGVGHFSSLAPGVNFAGYTTVGRSVEIGIGVSTIQRVAINDYAVIGGQSMVVKDVDSNDIIAGIPARSIKKS